MNYTLIYSFINSGGNLLTVSLKKIVFLSILVLVISSTVTFGANATSYPINRNQKLESISNTSSNSILTIAKFDANEQRIISYSLLSETVANITIDQTVATYQQSNSATAPLFTSYSNSVNIQIVPKTISQSAVNLDNLIMLSIVAIFYCVILVVRIIFNLSKKSKT